MKIAISGVGGFIGSYLSDYFKGVGHEIMPLHREMFQPEHQELLNGSIAKSEVVINLAGRSVFCRWTERNKMEILNSRIETTRKIVHAINHSSTKPQLFISASAVGYYPSDGCYDEFHQRKGKGFLPDVCEKWEEEAEKVSPEVRLAITRFGIVLAPKGGAFPKMILPSKVGMGMVLGSGDQSFSWIDIRDLARAMEFIMEHGKIDGPINLTAPEQITNKNFTHIVSRHYNTKVSLHLPESFLKLFLGEAAGFLLKGQCISPLKLIKEGFTFYSPNTTKFLQSLP
ncbi:MAG: TIGR01777 family oxidoreductase [Tannerellaceae bacterium]|nr:TIGR01777 family oxidoreductase [Tannerellaceae bacterium]